MAVWNTFLLSYLFSKMHHKIHSLTFVVMIVHAAARIWSIPHLQFKSISTEYAVCWFKKKYMLPENNIFNFLESKMRPLEFWTAVWGWLYKQMISGGFKGGKGGANPPLAASNVFLRTYWHKSIKCLYGSGMQQQQPGAVTHSRISSLLISRRLSRARVASRYSVPTSSYFKQLTSLLRQ